MSQILIVSEHAPNPLGPYAHAVLESWRYRLHISGQSGRDPKTGKLAEGIEAQTEQTLNNIETLLGEVQWNWNHVICIRAYLTDMSHYELVNGVYQRRFQKRFPARAALGVVALPGGALIEMKCEAGGNTLPEQYIPMLLKAD